VRIPVLIETTGANSMKNFTIEAQLIRSAMACQAKNSARYYLTGFLLSASGHIVGTNGNILFKSDYKLTGDDSQVVLSEDVIFKIDGTIPLNAITCDFAFLTEVSGTVTTDNGKLFSFHVIDGRFPDYPRVIPESDRAEFSNGFDCNVDLLARLQKVFGKDAIVRFEHGTENDSILITCSKMESALFVLMPCRSDKDYRRNFVAKQVA
jgi:hypothetical protein